jgi:hypothetical protein
MILLISNSWAQEPAGGPGIQSLMTATEFQQAGLQKLTPAELAALSVWFYRTVVTLMGSGAPAPVSPPVQGTRALDFSYLEGAIIVAEDGEFLGKITTNSLDPQSIGNQLGKYGSNLSKTSIFNELSRYGGEIARMSPFNNISQVPPRILKGERFIAFLTVNDIKAPRVDPRALIAWIKANE